MIRWDRALRSASDSRDWREVVKVAQHLHSRGLISRQSRFLLGSAYLHLGDNEGAIRELSTIVGRLRAPEDEARRHLNLAIALRSVERSPEAALLLRSQLLGSWPSRERDKALRMLEEIGDLAPPIQ